MGDDDYFIYLLSDGDRFKVGITNNLERRLSQCQTGNSRTLFYVCVGRRRNKQTALYVEKSIHRGLKQYRLAGEWFALNDALIERVRREIL